MGALAVEGHAGLEVADAAGVDDAVGRLEHDRELGITEEATLEERGKGALVDRHLLAREEEVARGHARSGELDHHRDPRLHVARAETVHGAVGDPPGDVPLRGHRVEVTGEHHGRTGLAVQEHLAVVVERSARQDLPDERHERRFGAALGGHVDELERSFGEIWAWHAVVIMTCTWEYDSPIPRRASSPSAGSSWPCLRKRSIRTTSLRSSRSSPARQASSPLRASCSTGASRTRAPTSGKASSTSSSRLTRTPGPRCCSSTTSSLRRSSAPWKTR